MSTWPGYDLDFNLEQSEVGFRMMASGDYWNLRLHAFGDKFMYEFGDPGWPHRAQIGIFLTSRREWLSDNVMGGIERWELDADEPVVDSSSLHFLCDLQNPMRARTVMREELSQLRRFTNSEYREEYANFIGQFISGAALESIKSRCRGMVVVVEINQPRILGAAASPLIKVVEFSVAGEGVREDGCVICWERYSAGARVACLACSHDYHEVCIQQWFLRASTCPLCRSGTVG